MSKTTNASDGRGRGIANNTNRRVSAANSAEAIDGGGDPIATALH